MSKLAVAFALFALAGCGGSTPAEPTTPDPAVAGEAEAFVRELFGHVSTGHFAGLKATACPEAVIYDADENNQPVVARGKAEVDRLLDGFQALSASGMQLTAELQTLECRPMIHAATCTLEFDQTATREGAVLGTMKFRATMVVEKHGGRWIWAHWHGSLRELPAAPAAAPAAP